MRNATDYIVSLINKATQRLLKLYFPNDDGPDAGLLVNHLLAEEHVSRDFTFTVTVISDDPHIELTDVQGRMVCVEMLREDRSQRYFNGYCFQFSLQRIENGLAIYEMVLKPWLAFFSLRSNHRLFHHKSISDQSKLIFHETGQALHEFRLHESEPVRTFSCQYNETDYNYLHRRWEEMGWLYWYEHTFEGHKLIIADLSPTAAVIDGKVQIPLHHAGGSNKVDKIAQWSPKRSLVSGRVDLGSFDFKRPSPKHASDVSNNKQGDVHQFEVYQYQNLYGFKDADYGKKMAQRKMEQIDCESLQIRAKGNHRAAQSGRWFSLQQNLAGAVPGAGSGKGANEFFILGVRHVVDNNYLNAEGQHAQYENSFTCIPRGTRWRPAQGFNSEAVKIAGIDSAIVVGPAGEDIYTDEYGRIRVQFHWDKQATDDQSSSAWIRVANTWACAEQGAISVPRIGSEVLVQWLGGSPDRPIVTGCVHNAAKMPAWKLPSQQALSGLRSRELGGGSGNAAVGRSNHLILDDTLDKIQAQLKSDHEHSQLSLGHITRIESNEGRKDWRGEGFELRTDAWGAIRAGKGMLISTEARHKAGAHIKDMGEALGRLSTAQEQHHALAEHALAAGAQIRKGQQIDVAKALRTQNVALHGETGPQPQLAEPHLVLSSPAGIEATTGGTLHLASDRHTAITAGKDLSISSGNGFFASIGQTFRLFVQNAGMKMIAAAGDIDIEALKNSINVLAKLNITHQANRITLTANEEIIINGGGSYAKFSAGKIEMGTSGKHEFHAAQHSFVGPKDVPIPKEELVDPEKEIFSQQFDLSHLAYNAEFGFSSELISYKVFDKAGKFLTSGTTNEDGLTDRILTNAATELVVLIGDGAWEIEEHFEHEELSQIDRPHGSNV